MREWGIIVYVFFALFQAALGGEPIELELKNGSRLKGEVVSKSASAVTVQTEFGVLRVPFNELTDKTRAKVIGTADGKASVEELLARIAELEKEIAALKAENAVLRGRLSVSEQAPARAPPAAQGLLNPSAGGSKPAATKAPEGSGQFWLTTSSRKRHNARCRYFRSSNGRMCGPDEGTACKICGG